MEHVIHHLTLDLTKPDMMPRVEVQQDNARTLVISLTQGGRPYWIADGVTAVFSGRKPDGNPLFNACTVEKNRVRYEFTPQTTNVAGIVECEILLYSRDERILASPRFELAVDELIHRDSDVPESTPELSALTRMVAAGTAMIEDLRRALAGLGDVDEILEQAASYAEQAKESAERAEKAAEEFGPGSVDMTGYAEKEWVREGFQPKGNYLTAAPVTSVNGRIGKVLLSAPDVGARPDSWTPTAKEVGARPDSWTPTAKEVGAMPAETKIPGKTSELENDSGFIDKAVSDLKNYYTRAQTQELIAAIPRFRVAVVQQLPSPGEELVLYLVPFAGAEGQYVEYIWVENRFEIIGIQQVDLTGYATEDWVRELLADTAGDYLPMPKAYNAGAWVFVEEVDGKGNVSKTGTKVLDWVATHTSRVDPSDQVLVHEVTLQTGITNAFGYDTLVGQTEVLVVCDGKLYLRNVEFGYSEGDGYFYHLGNKSLLFQATDTGEPFFFHGYKGTGTMAHFSTTGEHTVEIYGGEEVLIYNKMPEEYLPDSVGKVRTVNGVPPDENGNVNVDGAGSGQTRYYASLSAAVTDINNGVWDNALTDISTAKTKVFTAHTGALTVMLMDDVSESAAISVSKDMDLVLNGKTLSLTTPVAELNIAAGVNFRINGVIPGSAVRKECDSSAYGSNVRLIYSKAKLLEVLGGEYVLRTAINAKTLTAFNISMSSVNALLDGCGITVENLDTTATKAVRGFQNDAKNLCIRNCIISCRNGVAQGIMSYTSKVVVEDSFITAVANPKDSRGVVLAETADLTMKNCTVFADSPYCHAADPGCAMGISASEETAVTLDNCTIFGTHSGVSAFGNLYVNGGIYTGYCHGGVYCASKKDMFINDATLRCGNYEGEFDYSGKTSEIYGSVYIGGDADANGLSAYLDGCVITNEGEHPIVMRGTDGEHDNAVYISNSTVLGTIRIDNDTLKLYVGVGTDITTDKVDNPTRAAFDGKLYRRLDPGREATGADWEALRAYVESSFA